MKALLFSIALTFASNAFATGGFTCSVDDQNIKLDVAGTLSRSIPGAFNIQGSLEFKKDELKNLNIAKIEELPEFWLNKGQLNVRVYKETTEGDFASADLVIQTTMKNEDGEFEGSYELNTYIGDAQDQTTKVLQGAIKCSVE